MDFYFYMENSFNNTIKDFLRMTYLLNQKRKYKVYSLKLA